MRIGMDGRLLLRPLRGMGVYTSRILNGLLKADSGNEYFLYVDTTYEHNAPAHQYGQVLSDLKAFPNLSVVDVHAPSEFMWEQVYLPRSARRHRLDLLHMPANRAPLQRAARRTITTLHDTIETFPFYWNSGTAPTTLRARFYNWRVERYIRFLYQNVFRRQDLIITDSECSKADIQRVCGVPSERIKVIHLAGDERFRTLDVSKENFLLTFGSDVIHKNCARVIRAYASLPSDLKRTYKLRMVGQYPGLERLARELGEDNILFEPADFSAKLVETYNRATAFVFASLYEGFGIPPVEAMACGTPVIASSASSVPEVVGDAALLVDPQNVSDIAAAMERILTDAPLRADLAKAGLARAKTFSWKNSVEQHVELYRNLLAPS